MKNYVFGLFALVLAGWVACKKTDTHTSDCSEPVLFSLGDTVSLCLGQEAKFSGAAAVPDFVFADVPFDNRCPDGAQCIIAGWVEVQLKSTLAGQTQTDTLSIGDVLSARPDSMVVGSAHFRLLEVSPYPVLDKPIDKKDYKVRIAVW